MSEKYKNRYRIKSARHPTWDYGSNAAYFVTICTHGREHFFGEITNKKMQLSPIGEIANACWSQIPEHFPFIKLGAHIIMPNHVHGIIIIDKPAAPAVSAVQMQNFASLSFKWQPRFHDHIIRNQRSFDTISQYIVNNPLHWSEDKLYT